MSNSIKDSAQAFAVNQVLKYVDSNPQEAFPKLLDWADKFDKDMLGSFELSARSSRR